MAGTALDVSRHVFGGGARGEERGGNADRVANQRLAAAFLDDVMTLAGPLLPRAPVVLEYRPYVRQMSMIGGEQRHSLEGLAAARSEHLFVLRNSTSL